jgi:hypothetical protein
MSHTPPSRFRRDYLVGLFRFSVASFLAALVLLLVSTPLVNRIKYGELLESVFFTLVMVFGVVAVGHRRWAMWLSVILVLPPLLAKWLYHFWPAQTLAGIYMGGAILFILFIIGQLLWFILRAPRVDSEVLCAGISCYLLLGFVWAFAYLLIARQFPGAFAFNAGPEVDHVMTPFTCLYFSYITLSTVGYGDITPVADVVRMLAAAESMTGTLFVAVLISRLVSMYSAHPPDKNIAGKT